MSADLLYKVAYEEAVRAVSEQRVVIDSIRNRAGLLLSAAAVTTSFLAAQALHGSDPSPFSWLALAGFSGVAAASLAVLWPRKWEMAANPRDVIVAHVEFGSPAPADELHRDLSLYLYGTYLDNNQDLAKLIVFFQIANVLLAAEVVLWIVAIAQTS